LKIIGFNKDANKTQRMSKMPQHSMSLTPAATNSDMAQNQEA